MKLTGKCKEDFEKWIKADILSEHRYSELITNGFSQFPESMQYGVYVDFFDSVGIRISTNQFNKEYWFDIDPQAEDCECLKTRPEARAAAIEKANEIKNKQYDEQ